LAAPDLEVQLTALDYVVRVTDGEDLMKLVAGKLSELVQQLLAPVFVLAAADLVEDHEAVLGAALTSERARQSEPQTQGREILCLAFSNA
jgi:hypothetical protein